MGDRGNIEITYANEAGTIYFYTHWEGSALSNILAKALERGEGRWCDEAYLARVIFCEMVRDDVVGSTGYGIAPYIGDNEHPVINVNMQTQTVATEEGSFTFQEFIEKEKEAENSA